MGQETLPFAPHLQFGESMLVRASRKTRERVVVFIGGKPTFLNEHKLCVRDHRRDELCKHLASRSITFYDSHIFVESHGRDSEPRIDHKAEAAARNEALITIYPVHDIASAEWARTCSGQDTRFWDCELRRKMAVVWWLPETLSGRTLMLPYTHIKSRQKSHPFIEHAHSFHEVAGYVNKALTTPVHAWTA